MYSEIAKHACSSVQDVSENAKCHEHVSYVLSSAIAPIPAPTPAPTMLLLSFCIYCGYTTQNFSVTVSDLNSGTTFEPITWQGTSPGQNQTYCAPNVLMFPEDVTSVYVSGFYNNVTLGASMRGGSQIQLDYGNGYIYINPTPPFTLSIYGGY